MPKKPVHLGTNCFATNCKTRANVFYRNQGLTFHKFPSREKSPDRYQIWVLHSRRTVEPSKFSRLCSKHFNEEDIDRTGNVVRLKNNAVPKQIDLPSHLQNKADSTRTSTAPQVAIQPIKKVLTTNEPEKKRISTSELEPCKQDHAYAGNNDTWKRKCHLLEDKVKLLQKKLNTSRKKIKRFESRCNKFMEKLEQANSMNTELKRLLEDFSDILVDHFENSQ